MGGMVIAAVVIGVAVAGGAAWILLGRRLPRGKEAAKASGRAPGRRRGRGAPAPAARQAPPPERPRRSSPPPVPAPTPWPVRSAYPPRRWLLDALAYFRPLGFFEKEVVVPDDALAEKLEALHREETGEFDPGYRDADIELLRLDPDRVWFDDIGDLALPGNGTYVEILEGWARVSRGAFRPTGIREEWIEEGKRVQVRFTLDGAERMLRPGVFGGGAVDFGILQAVNRWMAPSGMQFEIIADEPFTVVALRAEEKRQLFRRGFRAAWD